MASYSMIGELNKRFEGSQAKKQKKVVEEAAFAVYEKYQEEKEVLQISFDALDVETGKLSKIENGIIYVVPGAEVEKYSADMGAYTLTRFINRELTVMVSKIDKKNRTIYFCFAPQEVQRLKKGAKSLKHKDEKAKVSSELNRAIENGDELVVWGRIKQVRENVAMVDIFNLGIQGHVHVKYWRKDYTKSLIGRCEPGEYYQFRVVKKIKNDVDSTDLWTLSRVGVDGESPWDNPILSTLKADDIVVVKCIQIPEGKSYWWGVSSVAPDIDIMGDFNERFTRGVMVREGITYKCKIKKIERGIEQRDKFGKKISKNIFAVKPFAVIKEDEERLMQMNQTIDTL